MTLIDGSTSLRRCLPPNGGAPAAGAVTTDGDWRSLGCDLDELLRLRLSDIRAAVDEALARDFDPDCDLEAADVEAAQALPPASGQMEVWAAGVTYERSRDAREEESEVADVYAKVYDAARPELFFKSVPWKVVTDAAPVGIREDSALNVPEPEVAVLVNAFAEIVGFTICNDVSSRSIEGENPLYLPQAKVYWHSCAIAASVRPAWEVTAPDALDITAEIRRGGVPVWDARGTTAKMRRSFDDLVSYAFAADDFPDGMVLSTGTMLVPEMDVTLQEGDEVAITIAELGTLVNPVVVRGSRMTRADGQA